MTNVTPHLPLMYNCLEQEKKWNQFWNANQIYHWDPKVSDQFSIDTPPPTVSGTLHMGHVYSYTQTDFIARFHRMRGKNVFYPIGFDDNGLPTERLVEKQKGVRGAHMARADFVALCQEVIQVEEEKFKQLFQNTGISVDWNLVYQTISPLSCRLAQASFLRLLTQKEVYRSDQPVLWDPVDGTALAQADIEEKEQDGCMYDVLFHHATTHAPLTIATTRPELLPACVALFYHPDDLRYQHLSGDAISPIFHQKVPIFADDLVQPNKGSGLVMCCTFGDQTDIIWWKKHQLATKVMINKAGLLTGAASGPLKGLNVQQARKKMVSLLQEAALLQRQTVVKQVIKCAERSGGPLEILTIPQWFIRTVKHKSQLLVKTNQLKWYPIHMKHRLETWIQGMAWDWCISRQRYFGVPFPIWYSKRPGEIGKILLPTLDQLPVNPLQDLPAGYTKEEVTPDYDVMDTWATSSISPQLSTHAMQQSFGLKDAKQTPLFPMDLRAQAHEIIRTWAFYTLLQSHLHEDNLPWKNIMIHGWCLAPDKNKMSKSKGNAIAPADLLEKYGADVIRYWSANGRLGVDTCYCEDVVKNGKRLVTKLWNAGKFILQHLSNIDSQVRIQPFSMNQVHITYTLDQWLFHSLHQLIDACTTHWNTYAYTEALALVERFFWAVFCDNYLEIVKLRAYNQTNKSSIGQYSAILSLYHGFYLLLQLFAPILPYITETLAQGLYPHQPSIHQRGGWPTCLPKKGITQLQIDQAETTIEVLSLVRKMKSDQKLSIKSPIQQLSIDGNLSKELIADLQAVTMAKNITLNQPIDDQAAIQSIGKHCKIAVLF